VSDAVPYQGRHLVADLHGCSGLDDEALIRSALTRAAAAAAATLLDIRLHAIDIFMCGLSHDLDAALDCLVEDLGAKSVSVASLARGYASVPLVQIGEARPTNR
jgi:S-adenosylmethionine decarboxylase